MSSQYIKSPLNYTGGKYKLLHEILQLFPKDIETFVDLFGGGFNVGININCNNIIYNDSCIQVVDLLKHFYNNTPDFVHQSIIDTITNYDLNRAINNKTLNEYKLNYLKLRNDYNKNPDWIKFYTLITCSFGNQIRFNSNNEFNVPYGKRDYNLSLQNKLKLFTKELHKKNIQFWNEDFRDCTFLSNDFVYCDPPYYNSVATYNENGGWSEQDEKDLLSYLDNIDSHGGKFALSNNLKCNNPFLKQWKDKYNIHYLYADYSNCNYHKKDRSQDTEVLITNY